MLRWLVVAAIVILMVQSGPLRADEMPWCVELDVFTKNCSFASYDECVAVAKNAVSPATGETRCVRNPRYQQPIDAAKAKLPRPAKSQR